MAHPLYPENVYVVRRKDFSIIKWDPVIKDTNGDLNNIKAYRVYKSYNTNKEDESFALLKTISVIKGEGYSSVATGGAFVKDTTYELDFEQLSYSGGVRPYGEDIVDQFCAYPDGASSYYIIKTDYSVGQIFTPSKTNVSGIRFTGKLNAPSVGAGSYIQLLLEEGNTPLGGITLATATLDPSTLLTTDQKIVINFASNISVIPGKVYTLTLSWASPDPGNFLSIKRHTGVTYAGQLDTVAIDTENIETDQNALYRVSAVDYSDSGFGINWQEVTHTAGVVFLGARMVTESEGWIVGDNGTIMHTTDKGLTWAPQVSGTAETLHDVFFTDPLNGWIGGDHGTILHTSDGGVNWGPQVSGEVHLIKSIFMWSTLVGWALTDISRVLKTVDGGTTWTLQATIPATTYNIVFGTSLIGYASDFKTEDGGDTWVRMRPHSYAYQTSIGCDFNQTDIIYTAGASGNFSKSIDGGLSWDSYPVGNGFMLANLSLVFTDLNTGWLGDSTGDVYATQDGGNHWEQQINGSLGPILTLAVARTALGTTVIALPVISTTKIFVGHLNNSESELSGVVAGFHRTDIQDVLTELVSSYQLTNGFYDSDLFDDVSFF